MFVSPKPKEIISALVDRDSAANYNGGSEFDIKVDLMIDEAFDAVQSCAEIDGNVYVGHRPDGIPDRDYDRILSEDELNEFVFYLLIRYQEVGSLAQGLLK